MEPKKFTQMLTVISIVLIVATPLFAALYVDASNRATKEQNELNRLNNLYAMNYPVLNQAQAAAQGRLDKVINVVQNMSTWLALVGLNSTQTRQLLNEALSADPYIIDLLTMRADGMVLAAEPSEYSFMEGQDFSSDAWTQKFLRDKYENISDVFLSTEGPYGAILMVPTYDSVSMFSGAVIALIDVQAIVDDSVAQLAAQAGCSYDCMQKNGFIIASSSPAELHLNAFTSPEFNNYTQLRALNWRVVNETSGYGTYQFPSTLGGTNMFTKDMFWVSFGFRGIEWRLMVQHAQ
jgi:hypothetical protein